MSFLLSFGNIYCNFHIITAVNPKYICMEYMQEIRLNSIIIHYGFIDVHQYLKNIPPYLLADYS